MRQVRSIRSRVGLLALTLFLSLGAFACDGAGSKEEPKIDTTSQPKVPAPSTSVITPAPGK
jgi:hypothetical protein